MNIDLCKDSPVILGGQSFVSLDHFNPKVWPKKQVLKTGLIQPCPIWPNASLGLVMMVIMVPTYLVNCLAILFIPASSLWLRYRNLDVSLSPLLFITIFMITSTITIFIQTWMSHCHFSNDHYHHHNHRYHHHHEPFTIGDNISLIKAVAGESEICSAENAFVWDPELKNAFSDECRSAIFQLMNWMEWDWKCLGAVKYRTTLIIETVLLIYP